MIKDFILPDIGEGIVECELVKWLVKEGDVIAEDQPVAEVMTDKALVEIPAPDHGRVTKLYHREGDIARVHEPLFAVEVDADEAPSQAPAESVPAREPESTAKVSEPVSQPVSSGVEKNFILPDIGEGIVECEVVTWRVSEGEEIAEDQPVVDVMTDKAMVEIPAPEAGRVTRFFHPEGEVARVHDPLFAYIPAEADAGAVNETPRAAAATTAEPEPKPSAPVRATGGHKRIPASPAVRRMVRELSLDLSEIPGSGKDGRVLKEDILRYRKQQPQTPAGGEASPAQQAEAEIRVEPLRGVRAVMAKRMAEAAATIPHFTYGDEVDVTDLLALRQELKPLAEKEGVRLTLMPFIMKAMSLAVNAYPLLNSQVDEACTEIRYQPHCNIGVAVDTPSGLIVPNVKRVETLSILAIAREMERLTNNAREGRVKQEDLQGGTISISNIGALGGTYASPIISKPEVAIVALGRTQQVPRFDDQGQVMARSIMNISWSGDHRIIDGGTMARFSNLWKEYLQSPSAMLLHLS